MITISVPMPPQKNTSNSRVHWRVRAEIRRADHLTGATLAREQLQGHPSPFTKTDALKALVTVCPKTKVCPDLDNALSGVKGIIDGACAALGVDDRQLRLVTVQRNDAFKTGTVIISLDRAAGEGMAT